MARIVVWAYYNENDPQKAQWIRELIKAGVVEDGEVDERSISDVQPDDLRGFRQCHFFAGIAVWSYALRLAKWPEDQEVWTGSCPCPSFSAAGKGTGFNDPRHLWPAWARLIRERKPATIFGEQADDAIGYGWIDLVQADLEKEEYAVGKAVLGACSVGAPHIRQRLYFVANAEHAERRPECEKHQDAYRGRGFRRSGISSRLDNAASTRCDGERQGTEGEARNDSRLRGPESGCATGRLDESNSGRRTARQSSTPPNGHGSTAITASAAGELEHAERNGWEQGSEMLCEGQPVIPRASESLGLGDASGARLQERECNERVQRFALATPAGQATERGSYVNGFWRDADWVLRKRWNSEDWEWCPTEPGTFPLVTGATARVLRLRGYGDALCAEVAKAFIETYLEARGL